MATAIRVGRAGTESYLQKTANLPSIASFTISVWFMGATISGDGVIATFGTGDTAYHLYWEGSSNKLTIWNGTTSTGGTVLTTGRWYHAMLAVNGTSGTNALAYLDGALDISATAVGTITGTAISLGSQGAGAFFNGTIGAVKVWNRVLTIDEVNAERPAVLAVNRAALLAELSCPNGWDVAASGLVLPHGMGRFVDTYSNTSLWAETGTIDTDNGPPIAFAPSRFGRRARYLGAGAPPVVGVVQRRTLGHLGARVGSRRAA